jgi:quinol monooxygenase YgiN
MAWTIAKLSFTPPATAPSVPYGVRSAALAAHTPLEEAMTDTSALTVAFVARLVARDGMSEEVAGLLAGAVQLANEEAGTIVWLALRSDETTFWIVDAFPTDDARQAHITGPIAQALMANADRLLAVPPEILRADVLASKVP